MPVFLLDVNVLMALFWPAVEAHGRAQEWFERRASEAWATCPITQTAFVRLLSNPNFSRNALTPLEAESLLHENLDHPGHQFWPDGLSVRDAIAPLRRSISGHRQITDAYLLGLAISRQGRLATFDKGIASHARAEELRAKYIEQL